jgi:hypothetical protein
MRCENSPLCDRCGHPRADHTRVFVRQDPKGCARMIGDFQSGRSWPCECEGFRAIAGPLGNASFASAEPPPEADQLPPLRLA